MKKDVKPIMKSDQFFNEIIGIMKEDGTYPDGIDYALSARNDDVIEMSTPYFSILSCLDYGGSEGIYLDLFYCESLNDNRKRFRLGTIKTLHDDETAMRMMGKLLADFTVRAREYVNCHYDMFDRRGYSVYGYTESGEKTSTIYLLDDFSEVAERVAACRRNHPNVTRVFLRDKLTGEEKEVTETVDAKTVKIV